MATKVIPTITSLEVSSATLTVTVGVWVDPTADPSIFPVTFYVLAVENEAGTTTAPLPAFQYPGQYQGTPPAQVTAAATNPPSPFTINLDSASGAYDIFVIAVGSDTPTSVGQSSFTYTFSLTALTEDKSAKAEKPEKKRGRSRK